MIKLNIVCPSCHGNTIVDKEALHYPCTNCTFSPGHET